MSTIDKLAEVARNKGVAVGGFTLAMGAGFLAGYYFAKHRLEEKIQEAAEERLEEQIEATRKHFTVIREDSGKPATPADAVEERIPEAAEVLRNYIESDVEAILSVYQGKHEDDAVDDEGNFTPKRARLFREDERPTVVIPAERRNNIWQDDAAVNSEGENIDFDYAEEMAARTEFEPYIISVEEFMENPRDYKQIEVTWFAGDEILIDDEDQIVSDPEKWIGDTETNLRFGHRSGDNRLVYIRNPVADYEFQVALSAGSYGVEVAGFDQEVGKQ